MQRGDTGISARLDTIESRIKPWTDRLLSHPVYGVVRDDHSLRIFMQSHVFCVWDFMSLVTALRSSLTGVSVPWLPTADPEARRLVNEILLDEESDETPAGPLSHFELYLSAMHACGADTRPIEAFIALVRRTSWRSALAAATLPAGVAPFVETTLEIATQRSLAEVAAVFTFSREEVIPSMFEALVARLSREAPERWSLFLFYLRRHIEVDRDSHAKAARELVGRTCGSDPEAWERSARATETALRVRIALWDAIYEQLRDRDPS